MKLLGGLDLATGALFAGGTVLIGAAIAAAIVLLAPPETLSPSAVAVVAPEPTSVPAALNRPSVALPADRLATILYVDAGTGAAGATRAGDRIDVLGYFSHQATGADGVTRVVLQDIPVLTVDRSGPNVGLTLSVPRERALLLQEAQALGGRPFVTLRSEQRAAPGDAGMPTSFSDSDLVGRLAGVR